MNYFILKVPIFLWLLTLTILGDFFLYSLFLKSVCILFSLCLGDLTVSSIHISNKILMKMGVILLYRLFGGGFWVL